MVTDSKAPHGGFTRGFPREKSNRFQPINPSSGLLTHGLCESRERHATDLRNIFLFALYTAIYWPKENLWQVKIAYIFKGDYRF